MVDHWSSNYIGCDRLPNKHINYGEEIPGYCLCCDHQALHNRKLNSTLVGGNQLRLEATDLEPERAAIIVNTWAQEIVIRFNSLFGSGSTEIAQTESQGG